MVELSVCIVTYNTKKLLENCLRSIIKNTKGLNFEIIVVDNASTDTTAEMVKSKFKKVQFIKNTKNLLFSKAFNIALKKSRGNYCLILNSDTYISKNSLRKMYLFMEKNTNISASSCLLVDEKGTIDKTCSQFPTPLLEFLESNILTKSFRKLKMLKRFRYKSWSRKSSRVVDVIPGSFIFIRKSILKKIGYFDENLKLYYGENDLCLNIKRIKGKVFHYAQVKVLHFKSQTVKKLPKWELFQIAQQDMLRYYRKHFGFLWWLFLWIMFRTNWIYWRVKTLK